MILVAAVFSQALLGLICSCDHAEHAQHAEHVCCDCEEHHDQCAYHDIFFGETLCHLHFASDVYLAELFNVENRDSRVSSLDIAICLLQVISGLSGDDCGVLEDETLHENYLFSIAEWCGVSRSLRAPPVLV